MSRLSEIEPAAPATADRARVAYFVDAIAAFAGALLIFPFPLVKAALPLPAFIVSIVATVVVVHVVYLVVCLVARGRTLGMFLLDLCVASRPVGFWAALRWSSAVSVGFVPALFSVAVFDPVRGLPARWSGLSTVTTAIHDGSQDL